MNSSSCANLMQPSAVIYQRIVGGLGDASARHFSQKGYHVFAAVRNLSRAVDYSNATDPIDIVSLDVTSSESIRVLEAGLQSRLPQGKLDILVNNAGFGATGPLIEVDPAVVKQLF
ncbi:MAG: hypothetical protein Q9177_000139 [Variospora cf. flavescens]